MEALVAAARRFIASSPLGSPAKAAPAGGTGGEGAATTPRGQPADGQQPQSPPLDVGVTWVVKPLPGPLQRAKTPKGGAKGAAAPKHKAQPQPRSAQPKGQPAQAARKKAPPPQRKEAPQRPEKKSTFGRKIKVTPAAADAAAEEAAALERKGVKRSGSPLLPGLTVTKYRGPGGAPSPAYRGRGGSANQDGFFWRKCGRRGGAGVAGGPAAAAQARLLARMRRAAVW
jgi:hypothetical protein